MYYLKTQRLQNSNHYVYDILKSDTSNTCFQILKSERCGFSKPNEGVDFLSSLAPRRGFEKPLVSVNSNRHHAVFSDSQI